MKLERYVFRDRPADPWKNAHAQWNDVEMTWHHVLPFAMLRDCWNTLVLHLETNRKAAVALQGYMRLLSIEAAATLRGMKDGAELDGLALDRICQQVSWPEWNIVEGPSNRCDDAHSDSVLDRFEAALTPGEANVQSRIESLFNAMKIFNQASSGQKALNDQTCQALANVMNSVERSLARHRKIAFRESMWKMVPPADWKLQMRQSPSSSEEWKAFAVKSFGQDYRAKWKLVQWKKAGRSPHKPPA